MAGKRTVAVVQYASFRSFPVGGISIFLESVLPNLAEAFDLKLIGMSLGEPIGKWTMIQVDGRAYDFLPIVGDKKSAFIPDRVRIALATFRHRRAIRESGADAYYVHMTEAALGLLTTRKPVLIHVHGLYNLFLFSRFSIGRTRLFPWIYETFYPALFSRCARVLGTGSLSEYESFTKLMRITSGTRIPTCSRDRIFYPRERESLRASFSIAPEDRVVLFAGRMTPVKNLPMLLEAVRIVGREVQGLKLVMAGDGSARADAECIAGGMPNVRFLGMLNAPQLAEWMNAADVLALTSRIEGFPTAVVEGLSCGLPAVVTPVNAARELIQDGSGCDPRNGAIAVDFSVQTFADALRSVLMEPPHRDACVASIADYKPEAVAQKIIAELEAVFGCEAGLRGSVR